MIPFQIDFPSRVTVGLQIDPADRLLEVSDRSVDFTFVWGIGTSGLTDFELALSKEPQGKTVRITLGPKTVHEMFEHLAHHVLPFCRSDRDVCASASIQKVEPVSNRDLVKAMAGLLGSDCGCGGEGGCGCH